MRVKRMLKEEVHYPNNIVLAEKIHEIKVEAENDFREKKKKNNINIIQNQITHKNIFIITQLYVEHNYLRFYVTI